MLDKDHKAGSLYSKALMQSNHYEYITQQLFRLFLQGSTFSQNKAELNESTSHFAFDHHILPSTLGQLKWGTNHCCQGRW